MDTPEDKEYLALYSENCMTCSHLSEAGTVEHTECYYKNGNKQCPASEVRLVVVGEALTCARRVLRARDQRKPKLEAKVMKYVGTKSPAFQSKFYDHLENGGRLILRRGE